MASHALLRQQSTRALSADRSCLTSTWLYCILACSFRPPRGRGWLPLPPAIRLRLSMPSMTFHVHGFVTRALMKLLIRTRLVQISSAIYIFGLAQSVAMVRSTLSTHAYLGNADAHIPIVMGTCPRHRHARADGTSRMQRPAVLDQKVGHQSLTSQPSAPQLLSLPVHADG